ncbi:hypothetical protein IWW36_000430 [Coemansia brasiliensis]|uniref:Uncharacterized protein n=1 Tax=Coemansia brasiliensis TaxID=2650707 RepID=A0A9W8IHG9_9FUNG|nr:hypothetical protein IWW36_000430 [Coemansia brasiliensis]
MRQRAVVETDSSEDQAKSTILPFAANENSGTETTWVLEQSLETEPQLSIFSNENIQDEFVVTQLATSSLDVSTEWVADLHTSVPQAQVNTEPASSYQAPEQQSNNIQHMHETSASNNRQQYARSQAKHMNSWIDMPKIVYHPGVNGTQGYWGPEGMYPFDNVIMRFGNNNEHLSYGTMFINDTVVNGLHPYLFMGNDTLIDGWMRFEVIAYVVAVVAHVAAAAVRVVAAAAIAVTVAIAAAATAAAANAATAAATVAAAILAAVAASPAAASPAAANVVTAASLAASLVASNAVANSSAAKVEKVIMVEKGDHGGEGGEGGHGGEGGEGGEGGHEEPPPPGPEGPGPNGPGPNGPGGPEGGNHYEPPLPPPPPMPSKEAPKLPSKSPPSVSKAKIVVNQKVPIILPNTNHKLPTPGYITHPATNRISIYNIHSQPSTRITRITCPTQPYQARGGYQAIPYKPVPSTHSETQTGIAYGYSRVIAPQASAVQPRPVTSQKLPVQAGQAIARPAYQPAMQVLGTVAQRQVAPVQRQISTIQTIQQVPTQPNMLKQVSVGSIGTNTAKQLNVHES